jgi:hypothetical protein
VLLKTLLITALLGALGLGVTAFSRLTERTRIHNLSGQPITDVVLELHGAYQDTWTLTKKTPALRSGNRLTLHHSQRDSKAILQFTLGQRSIRFEEPYTDLWTGEGWCLDILPDGQVTGHYDYRPRTTATD